MENNNGNKSEKISPRSKTLTKTTTCVNMSEGADQVIQLTPRSLLIQVPQTTSAKVLVKLDQSVEEAKKFLESLEKISSKPETSNSFVGQLEEKGKEKKGKGNQNQG